MHEYFFFSIAFSAKKTLIKTYRSDSVVLTRDQREHAADQKNQEEEERGKKKKLQEENLPVEPH